MPLPKFSDLIGKTLVAASHDKDTATFETEDTRYSLYHSQDCCESVDLYDVNGDFEDLVGSPILFAEEVTSDNYKDSAYGDSYTWTFYRIGTVKGTVVMRWLGQSNGYYSERVDFNETAI